ncbi:hypothetical protein ZIOFF_013856 [Zingiber officinale]|uniref:Uncharacterized protein n=1 Tax=Zingiber officinale TaxID=94328 RepID=A0A8J5LL64_ZINOF|nr:hypothetical protein ZIOFF_013856 [Zingiber officinale]
MIFEGCPGFFIEFLNLKSFRTRFVFLALLLLDSLVLNGLDGGDLVLYHALAPCDDTGFQDGFGDKGNQFVVLCVVLHVRFGAFRMTIHYALISCVGCGFLGWSFSVASNGYFVIDLYGECYVDFEYVVYYAPRVSGFLGYDSVSNLEGVQIRSYLIWYGVSYIKPEISVPAGSVSFTDSHPERHDRICHHWKSAIECQIKLSYVTPGNLISNLDVSWILGHSVKGFRTNGSISEAQFFVREIPNGSWHCAACSSTDKDSALVCTDNKNMDNEQLKDDTLTGAAASVDNSTKWNLRNLVRIGENLLEKPASRVNLETGQFVPVVDGEGGTMSNKERHVKFAKTLSDERKLRQENLDDNRYNSSRGAHLNLKRAEKARILVNKIPACESGSIFEGLMPEDLNVYVTTTSNAVESSWGTYCPGMDPPPPPEYMTCLGDLYNVAWMEDRFEFYT